MKKDEKTDGLKVNGNGMLKIGTNTYPFSVDENGNGLSSEIARVDVDGETYYKGILQGHIKNKKGEVDVISIVTYFTDDYKHQTSNVIIGQMGQDIYLSFGDSAFLKQVHDKINTQPQE